MSPKMFVIVLCVVSTLSAASCIDISKIECVNRIAKLCKDMEKTTGVNVFMNECISWSKLYRISCVQDGDSDTTKCVSSDGTSFSCSPQGALICDDRQLAQGPTEGAQFFECDARDIVSDSRPNYGGLKAYRAVMDRVKDSVNWLKKKMQRA